MDNAKAKAIRKLNRQLNNAKADYLMTGNFESGLQMLALQDSMYGVYEPTRNRKE